MNNIIPDNILIKYIKKELSDEEMRDIKDNINTESMKRANVLAAELLLLQFSKEHKEEYSEAGCPPEELIIDYAEGVYISSEIKKDLDFHFFSCSNCEKIYMDRVLSIRRKNIREKVWNSNIHEIFSKVFSSIEDNLYKPVIACFNDMVRPLDGKITLAMSCSSEEDIFKVETEDYCIKIRKIDNNFYLEFISKKEAFDNTIVYYVICSEGSIVTQGFLKTGGIRNHKRLYCNLSSSDFDLKFNIINYLDFQEKFDIVKLEELIEKGLNNQAELYGVSGVLSEDPD
jgi:hypothetical protein